MSDSPGSLESGPLEAPAVGAAGIALIVLATLGCLLALSRSQAFVVPMLFAIVIAYTLNPLVAWLEAVRLPRALAALIVVASVVGGVGFGGYALRGQAQTIMAQLPEAASRISAELRHARLGGGGNMQRLQSAASQVERATSGEADSGAGARHAVAHVIVDQPTFRLSSFLWESSMGAIGAIGQAATVALLALFLLAGGDSFRRKLVRLAGPSLAKRRIAVHILDDINASIQKYMFMLLATNVLVAVLCWATFRTIGLENAGAWAAAAGMLHVIPYLGPAAIALATGMAAFLQFDSLALALLVASATLVIAVLVGTFVATWMTGRIARLSAVAIFISLLFWGWLWGVWGMLLSVPIVVVMKVVSEQVRPLHPVAVLLGE